MPRFAANLSMLYNEHAFPDRFAAAASDGFKAVEYLFPYAFAAADLARRLADHGLQQVLFKVIDEVSAACNWQGWVGCEYRPARGPQAAATTQGLDWLRVLRR